MTKLFQKDQVGFSLVWIGVYTVGMSLFEELSRAIGVESCGAAVFAMALSGFLLMWVQKNGLMAYFGLCKPKVQAKACLYYLPLAAITACNLWSGVSVHYDAVGTAFFVLKMLCVGFLEELIFRGFLFKGMCKSSPKWAIIVSSVTFGIGHIVNLFNGSGMGLADNLFQIVSAVAIGFLYVVIFYGSGSLLPCILSHGMFNALSAFAGAPASPQWQLVLRAILCLLAVGYTFVLWKTLRPKQNSQDSQERNHAKQAPL